MSMGQTQIGFAGPYGDGEDVFALAETYTPDEIIPAHRHARAQLLYGLTGVVLVQGTDGAWMMPPECGLWIPAGQEHEVRMLGEVRMRSLYLTEDAAPGMPDHCAVLAISDLVRTLLDAVAGSPAPLRSTSRGGLLTDLLLHEIPALPVIPLTVPMPVAPRLRALCRDFLKQPSASSDIAAWCGKLHMSRRSFTRHFRAGTGLSFVDWRQRACVMAAIPRLLAGEPVTGVALDLGYENPASFSTMFRRITGAPPSQYVHGFGKTSDGSASQ